MNELGGSTDDDTDDDDNGMYVAILLRQMVLVQVLLVLSLEAPTTWPTHFKPQLGNLQ